jgi:hypothetical protein
VRYRREIVAVLKGVQPPFHAALPAAYHGAGRRQLFAMANILFYYKNSVPECATLVKPWLPGGNDGPASRRAWGDQPMVKGIQSRGRSLTALRQHTWLARRSPRRGLGATVQDRLSVSGVGRTYGCRGGFSRASGRAGAASLQAQPLVQSGPPPPAPLLALGQARSGLTEQAPRSCESDGRRKRLVQQRIRYSRLRIGAVGGRSGSSPL